MLLATVADAHLRRVINVGKALASSSACLLFYHMANNRALRIQEYFKMNMGFCKTITTQSVVFQINI